MIVSIAFCLLATLPCQAQEADATPNPAKKCSFAAPLQELEFLPTNSKQKLLFFTSFSVPLESWKEHSLFLEKVGGCFVLKGLPQNSFQLLSQKLSELRQAGVRAQILIDPESFEKYTVQSIPTVILDTGENFDKLSGNLKLPAILSLFADNGATKLTAQKLLQHMEAP